MTFKHFRLNKDLFNAYNEYCKQKLNYTWFKKFIFSMLGGIFIGIGYVAMLMVMTKTNVVSKDIKILLNVISAFLFPVGLLLCIYLGGNLFTSNSMGLISIVYKDKRWVDYIKDLFITLVGNLVGCILIALVVWGAGLFGIKDITNESSGGQVILIMKSKFNQFENHDWWNNLLSAILCNVIIVGATFVSIITNKKGVGAAIVYLMLVVFVISGYQHVVANMFLFSLGSFLSIFGTTNETMMAGYEFGQMIYLNIIPSILGNWIGGIAMSLIYLWAGSYITLKKGEEFQDIVVLTKKQLNQMDIANLKTLWHHHFMLNIFKVECSSCHHKHHRLITINNSKNHVCHKCWLAKNVIFTLKIKKNLIHNKSK